MQAGKLKHQIIIQHLVNGKDASGGPTETWVDWKTVWAEILPAVGNVYYQAKQLDASVDGTIKIRYLKGLLPNMRAIWGDRTLNFISFQCPQEGRREIHIKYSEALD
jgi:SPP1 family predicted phage head-tail adaptor